MATKIYEMSKEEIMEKETRGVFRIYAESGGILKAMDKYTLEVLEWVVKEGFDFSMSAAKDQPEITAKEVYDEFLNKKP